MRRRRRYQESEGLTPNAEECNVIMDMSSCAPVSNARADANSWRNALVKDQGYSVVAWLLPLMA